MKQSPSIALLAKALVAAQAELKPVTKDATNPHFKSKFASYDGIVDTVRPVLAKYKIAFLQGTTTPESDAESRVTAITVETMLVHESGEFITNAVVIPLAKVDPQGAGSALTYGRRYSLSALLGLATDEDDDANHATYQHHTGGASVGAAASGGTSPRATSGATAKVMPFGKKKGVPLADIDVAELIRTRNWCNETDAKKFEKLIEALDLELDGREQAAGV